MAKKGLGKGLGTIFGEEKEQLIDESGILEVKITNVEPNKKQPRKTFDKEKLANLAKSIKEHGMIQPIIVTKNEDGRYSIVAGERRWRAAKLADFKTVPVVIKEYSDQTVAEIALIENLQREDLNPIEEAQGYKDLCDLYGLTQEDVSNKVGKSRSAIANSMRLLSLDANIQKRLINKEITEGHARAALSLEDKQLREFLINQVVENNLNVRQAEALAKQLERGPKKKKEPPKNNAYKLELEKIEKKLSQNFGTKVKILHTEKKGKIEIEYYGNDDLERLLEFFEK